MLREPIKEIQEKQNRIPSLMIFQIINQKPNFFYFQPKKIHEDQVPSVKQILQEQQKSPNLLSFSRKVQGEETTYDISQIKTVACLKFNKSNFVKMKNVNYSKMYKIVQNCIGKGAFGTVRKVQSLISKQYRAAKILKKSSMKGQEIQKLLTEVYIMMDLDHPNISNILEVYDYRNQFVLICQLCQGGDLLNYVKSHRRINNEKLVAVIIKQVLRAIMYLHNIGIVHRDIKPQNILFQKNNSPNIKLIDFGVATRIQNGQILNVRIGTPAYLAPELIFQKYTEKVDIWAVGITMYHLISGKIPFKGQNLQGMMHNIVKQQISFQNEIWKQVSNECIEVIKLMTIKNYMQRPSAKEIFQHPYFKSVCDSQLNQKDQIEFAQNMRKFEFKNKLQAAIQTFIASQLLSMQEKNELVSFFKQFDKNNDGVICTQQLRNALQKRKKMSTQRIQTLMDVIDTNGSGKIDYTQFLAAGFIDAKSFTTERLKQAFAHFDTNGNGKITIQQVKQFMSDFQQDDEEVQKIFLQFDINGDGSITQTQFINLMLQRTSKMNLSNIRGSSNKDRQMQKRMDKINLDKFCLDYVIPRGQTGIFFQNLTRSKVNKINQQKKTSLNNKSKFSSS